MMHRISTSGLSWALMIASWLGWLGGAWHHHEILNTLLASHPAVASHGSGDPARHLLPDDEQHCAICSSGASRSAVLPSSTGTASPLGAVGSASPDESIPLLPGSRFSPDQRGPPAV